MPYSLTSPEPMHWQLRLWPHNALQARGFASVIGVSAAALALPLLAVLGQPVLWGLLPFAGIALWGLWIAIRRNWRDRAILEELDLSQGAVRLRRTEARHAVREWQADPHWVRLHLAPRGGPVEQYLTLTGGTRAVELGAFLTPEERLAVHGELSRILPRLREPA
ncbi:DUF2244 domain-containing protein [Pararhodobacter sp. SW119]|uniref:DUF2244 domain-containing protein n=1 Tax=Pararhodobacter sp. SW119 TaxID=2780075 RepID=UPI001AE0429A|nr:DUF2244 domain-containing protein [Pararhodobacter sp. SW119]